MKRKTKTALVVLVVLLVALFGGSAVMAAGTGSVIKDGLAKFGPAHPHKGAGAGIGTLVKDGTLTEKQVQAVMEALRPEKAGEIKDMSEVLSSLVKAGTINEAQAEAIKKMAPARGGFLMSLVKDGTLTEKQAQAVMEALRPEKAGEIKDMSEVLSSLVKAGTINEAQAEAIKKLMPNRQHGRFGCLNGEQS